MFGHLCGVWHIIIICPFTFAHYIFCLSSIYGFLLPLLYLQTFLKQYQMYAIPLLCTVLYIILALYKTTNNNTCTFILITIKWGNEAIEQIYTIINIYSGMSAFIYMHYTNMICTMLHLFDDLWLDTIIPKNNDRRQSHIWKSRE